MCRNSCYSTPVGVVHVQGHTSIHLLHHSPQNLRGSEGVLSFLFFSLSFPSSRPVAKERKEERASSELSPVAKIGLFYTGVVGISSRPSSREQWERLKPHAPPSHYGVSRHGYAADSPAKPCPAIFPPQPSIAIFPRIPCVAVSVGPLLSCVLFSSLPASGLLIFLHGNVQSFGAKIAVATC